MAVVWVLVRKATGEYQQAELVFARTIEGTWSRTSFVDLSDWYDEAFERPVDEWEGWGPAIDVSESSGRSLERPDTPNPDDHPQTRPWGFLAVTGIAAERIRTVHLQASGGRETTVEVDAESGAFLAVLETLDEHSVLSVTGTTDSGETMSLD